MRVAVIAETDADEPRVAATPETVKKMVALGATVAVQAAAGVKSGILDADYTAAGAAVTADPLNDADIVLQVRRPEGPELARLKKGAIVIGMMDPYATTTRFVRWPVPASSPSHWSSCRASPGRK